MKVSATGALEVANTQSIQANLIAGLRTGLNGHGLGSVQGLQLKGASQGSCGHGNGHRHVQVVTLTRESRIALLDNVDVEITVGPTAGTGLALSGKTQAHSVTRAGGDINGQVAVRTNSSLTGAFVTGVFNDGSITLTAWAGNLSLHGSQHGALLLDRVSLSLTGRAGHRFGSRFAHSPVAHFAGHIGVERNLLVSTKSGVLQGNCNLG